MARSFPSKLEGINDLLYLIYGMDSNSFMQSKNVQESPVYKFQSS